MVSEGKGVGAWIEWEVGVSRCKLLYIEWINGKAVLYSIGEYMQCLMINHNGNEYRKKIYICVTESLYCTAEINTTL